MVAVEEDTQEPRQDDGDDETLVNVDRGGGTSPHRSLPQKIGSVVSQISIEPSLFLIMFGYGLYNVIAQVNQKAKFDMSMVLNILCPYRTLSLTWHATTTSTTQLPYAPT